jgi:dihydroorotase-like cyclic amidohydrolase
MRASQERHLECPKTFDLILKGGTVVNHNGEGVRDIGIAGGRIAALGDLAPVAAAKTVDCRGLHLLPGVINTQVHFREPGLTHKEDLETGSRSAVMGGVTGVFEMPNTNPTTTSAQAMADKVARAHHALRLRLLRRLKDHKDLTSVEATPNHLTLEAPGCYERLGARGYAGRRGSKNAKYRTFARIGWVAATADRGGYLGFPQHGTLI